MKATYCLCQDCLKVYPFTFARHQEEEFCSCGGQLCGCSNCDSQAENIQASKYVLINQSD